MKPLLLAALTAAALLSGAGRADASSFLGSLDTGAAPDGWACERAACAPGSTMGFRQFALRTATVEAPEAGVLVDAGAYARRRSGSEPARIAVLRPDRAGVNLTIVASAPVAVTSAEGALTRADGLHLEVEKGDSIGFLFRAGEVDLGTLARPRPDGAIQSFSEPCAPCGSDGGTGTELLFDATVEPDVDRDGMGDETQDADGGGLGLDWIDDWFTDYADGDELDEDFDDEGIGGAAGETRRRGVPRTLGLLAVRRLRDGRASALLRVPRAGRVNVSVTLPANGKGAGPFTTILTGDMRIRRAGRVRVRLDSTVPGARALSRRKRMRTKVVVAYFPRRTGLELLMHSARL
jgi:hypothetical protein